MIKILPFCILLFSISAFACFGPPSTWNQSDQTLIQCTENIVIAKFESGSLEIFETLKGNYQKGSKITVKATNNQNNLSNEIGINPDCSLITNFKDGKAYVIFHHAHHPKGYQNWEGKDDKWVKTIRDVVREKTKIKPKCDQVRNRITP